MIRRDAWREYSRGSLWLLPMVSVVLALLLGTVLSRVPVPPGSPLAFQGTADDARALLIGITGTMVTVIALLLGLAVVALQLSSTQFSPRLLRNYLRDRPNQIVLSVFVGTFAYSTGGLFEVGISGGERSDEFPRFAVTVAVALLFVSLVGDPDHRGTVGARRTSMVYQHHRRQGSASVAADPARRPDGRAGPTPAGLGTVTTRRDRHLRSGPGGAGSSSWWRRRRTPRSPGVRRHRQWRESAPRSSSWVAVNSRPELRQSDSETMLGIGGPWRGS